MLSTVVIGEDSFSPASGVLTVALVDDESPESRPVPGGGVAAELVDPDADEFGVRYVLPTPNGRLALLAEFAMPEGRRPRGRRAGRRADALVPLGRLSSFAA